MYNLVQFLLRYRMLFFFLLLQVFCFYLIFQNSHFHRALFINKANNINGRFFATYADISGYLTLGKVNDSLVFENAKLRNLIANYNETVKSDSLVADTLEETITLYSYKYAKVVKNSINQSSNFLFLDRGKLDSVQSQMGVISSNGIVGQVVSTTDHYAVVMSILNKGFRTSAKLKNTNYFGQLSWDGSNYRKMKLEEIPKHVLVKKGDTIVTSGFSSLFPEGVLVGTANFAKAEADQNFQEIEVLLAVDMAKLKYVYLIDHLYKNEFRQLDTFSQKLNVK
jgi:rod shape-determining protein MreC